MEDPVQEAQAGDILYGKNNRNIRNIPTHYIIYLSASESSDLFLGAMLTHSKYFRNIALQKSHFDEYDAQGVKWQVYYETSYISPELYQKKNDWRPFTKVGKLSDQGLQFVLESIGYKKPIKFPFNSKS